MGEEQKTMKVLVVTQNEAGQRLNKLLAKYLNLAGSGFIYKMLRKKATKSGCFYLMKP